MIQFPATFKWVLIDLENNTIVIDDNDERKFSPRSGGVIQNCTIIKDDNDFFIIEGSLVDTNALPVAEWLTELDDDLMPEEGSSVIAEGYRSIIDIFRRRKSKYVKSWQFYILKKRKPFSYYGKLVGITDLRTNAKA